MKGTAVQIATTEGPSEIQRITPEDPDVRSVICHDGRAIALPISPDYDPFVRRPTGVIEACFGHGAYRVDVAEPITSGQSWQLGLFIAHALYDEGRLVRSDDRTAQIVWATGEVTSDLAVAAVDEVDCKIRRSENVIRAHLEIGSRVILALPADNLAEATRALEDVFGDDCDRLHVVPAVTVCDVLSALGLKRPRRIRQWLARTPSVIADRGRMPRGLSYAFSLALVAVTAVTGWQKLDPGTGPGTAEAQGARAMNVSFRPGPAPSVAAASVASRAPDGRPCAAVHLDRVAPVVTERPVVTGAPVAGLRVAGLCDFHYRLVNSARRPALIWVVAQRDNPGGGAFRSRIIHAERALAAGESLVLDARPPRLLSTALRQSFFVVSLPAQTPSDVSGVRALWSRAVAAASDTDLKAALDGARSHGAECRVLTNDFRP
jgi:hypothetical protein